jgi:hypothetical protein
MNLLEAKDLFNEIVDNCPTLEGVHFMIAPSITANTIVEGYEIHMSGKRIEDETIAYLRDLASRNGLFIDTKPTAVGMYKAKEGLFK